MRSWHREFFAMPEEVLRSVQSVATRRHVQIVGSHAGEEGVDPIDSRLLPGATELDRLLLIPAGATSDFKEDGFTVGFRRSIVDVPAVDGGSLLMGRVHLKTDPDDEKNIAVFRAVDREISSLLVTSVVIENTVLGTKAVYGAIKCSAQAVAWANSGRELRQRGVPNLRFTPAEAGHDPH
jgi:hypothetical protein